MRNLKFALAFIAIILIQANASIAQTAEEIVQKHIDAMGGIDNWRKVNMIRIKGSTSANGTEIPLTVTMLQNKGLKVEYTFSGMTGYTIITDKTGWNYSPFGGQTKPEAMPDEAVKQAQDGLDPQGPLVDYKTKGHKIVYLGKDDVEGTDCYKLKLIMASGKEQTLYFDASNYYNIKSVTKVTANGKEMEQTSQFGNFQKMPEGIVYPMSIDQGMGMMTVKSVEINKALPDNFFVPAEMETKK